MLSVLLCAGLGAAPASAGVMTVTGPIVNPANGHTYYLLPQDTWTNSENDADQLGGHLATVNDAAEEQWIFNTFSDYGNQEHNLWIGLYDPDPLHNSSDRITRQSEFQWISGEPVTYTNWSPFEPSAGEPYVHIWHPSDFEGGKWNNASDNSSVLGFPVNGVVEIDPNVAAAPEPKSALLLSMGFPLLLVAMRRRRLVKC